MAPYFQEYAIPVEVEDLNSEDWTNMLLELGPRQVRTNAKLYHKSKSTMLYLEEYEESLKFEQFKINEISIEHLANDVFRFKNIVSFNKF